MAVSADRPIKIGKSVLEKYKKNPILHRLQIRDKYMMSVIL
jgi:hypothetical protein